MIDIHCHILPGIDDGPENIQTSLDMIRMAMDDGITHIVATPHYRYNERPTMVEIEEKLREVKYRIIKDGINVKIYGGADICLTYELMEGVVKGQIPFINSTRYFLLELPDLIPHRVEDIIFEARLRNLVPVITHPERNYSIINSPGRIDSLRDAGALFQITAMSITGEFGDRIEKLSRMFCKKGYVDFIASDAHGIKKRPPLLSAAYRKVAEINGIEQALKIFIANPMAVIEDREIH